MESPGTFSGLPGLPGLPAAGPAGGRRGQHFLDGGGLLIGRHESL
jgi:hypothetical protein